SELSVTVQVTVVIPSGKLAGASLVTSLTPHLSLVVGRPRFTFEAVHSSGSVSTETFAGAMIVGLILSSTVTVAVAVPVFPLLSVTVRVTVLSPTFEHLKEVMSKAILFISHASFEPLSI